MGTVFSSVTFGTAYEIGIAYKTAKLRVRGLLTRQHSFGSLSAVSDYKQ
jgi:hypothetical protein